MSANGASQHSLGLHPHYYTHLKHLWRRGWECSIPLDESRPTYRAMGAC